MSALNQLLERLRRAGPSPGAPARVVAVPSAGDELSREVSFLFGPLDEIERQTAQNLAAAQSQADEVEAAAARRARRMLDDAHAEAERLAAALIAEHRADSERRVRAMLCDAEREAERVRARGRERTPALVAEIVERLLAGGS
jgi:cell division septum initiation protein DivIVA